MSLARLTKASLASPDRGDAGQVALDVGGEHRHAGARKAFGQHLQRDGLAGAGRAGDQPVAVGEGQRQQRGFLPLPTNIAPLVSTSAISRPHPRILRKTDPRFVHNRGRMMSQ